MIAPRVEEAADDLEPTVEQRSGSIVYALVRFRGVVGATAVLGTVVGLAFSLMRANSFTSTGTLLLRSGARETATAESTVAGRESHDMRLFDFLANEMQILSHRDAFRRAIDKVGVARILEVFDPAAEDDAETSVLARGLHELQSWWFANSAMEQAACPERREDLALKRLTTNLSLRPSGSSMIRVSYEAHTPELAKEIVDAFLAAAEEHHRHVFSNRTSFEFLTVVEKQAREAAKAATAALMEFKQEHGIFDLTVQRTALMADITKLETQLASDEDQLQVHESRCETLRRLLAGEERFEEAVTDTPPLENPEYRASKEQIFTLRKEQATLKGNAVDKQETERRIKALDELVADVELHLQGVPPLIPGPKSRQSVKNPGYERLRGLLDEDELKVVTLRVARDRQAARLEKLRRRVQGLQEIGPCHDALVEEVAKHENEGRRLLESLKNAELMNLLDENKLSNLRILEAGDLPMKKSGPNRALWALLGAACGFMLGVGVALLRHRSDGSVRRAQDLQAAGAEVLGVVPESKAVAARQLSQDASPDVRDRPLRQRLDSVWAALLPSRITHDFRSTIAMVGDEHSSGVTTLALHFAARAASCHHLEVLLIETNYHHPALAARLGLNGAPGLADLIRGAATREEVVRPTMVPGLRIVHAGSSGAALSGAKAGRGPEELLRSLSDGFQIVLLDVPSIVEHPEFRHLVWCADQVVPVFAAGRSTKQGARELLHRIESAGKRASGAILNRWRSIRPFWLPRFLDI